MLRLVQQPTSSSITIELQERRPKFSRTLILCFIGVAAFHMTLFLLVKIEKDAPPRHSPKTVAYIHEIAETAIVQPTLHDEPLPYPHWLLP